jgi:hypothetical protein
VPSGVELAFRIARAEILAQVTDGHVCCIHCRNCGFEAHGRGRPAIAGCLDKVHAHGEATKHTIEMTIQYRP